MLEPIFPWIIAVLGSTPERWVNLVQKSPEELLNLAPAKGEWSALDCLKHLLDTERQVFPLRVRCFLEGRDFPAFDPDSEGTLPSVDQLPLALAQEFVGLRAESLALLDELSPSDLDRQAQHGELGTVTLSQMVHEWAAHDLMHTVQAERAMMQPFIERCGPWQPYFSEHIVGKRNTD
jgi:hypothetical protein